jgi:CRISPR system Cascade subunit CasA
MVFGQGWSRAKSLGPWMDAWVAFQRVKKKGADQAERVPLRPSEHRDAWRDFPALFMRHGEESVRPAVLDQVSDLLGEALPPEQSVTYEVFGLRTDMKAKLFEWRQETFRLPNRLIASPHAGAALGDALTFAEEVEKALRRGLKELVPDLKFHPPDPLVHVTLRSYWRELEGEFRRRILEARLTEGLDGREAWREEWRGAVRRAGRTYLERAAENFDATAEDLRRQVSARDCFFRALAGVEGRKS